jgi:hypothetical protein
MEKINVLHYNYPFKVEWVITTIIALPGSNGFQGSQLGKKNEWHTHNCKLHSLLSKNHISRQFMV